jgi:hypothetical protein
MLDYERVITAYELLHAWHGKLPKEQAYRLGYSLSQIDSVDRAVSFLAASIDTVGGGATPYYHAEALYQLSRLAESPSNRAYAQELRRRYSGSIYDNSVVAGIASQ